MVAAETITFGVLLGIPVLLVLLENAVNVGIIGGLMAAYHRSGVFWSLILPHGILELSAVFLAAGGSPQGDVIAELDRAAAVAAAQGAIGPATVIERTRRTLER